MQKNKYSKPKTIEPSIKPHICKRSYPLEALKHISMDSFVKERNKVSKKEGQFSKSPVLTIRPIDKQYTRRLSLSEMTHLDIKPRHSITPFPRTKSPKQRRIHMSKR
ncbi:uncharacterized protein LOC120635803 [Pararge aegeria]|uniref:Jg2200 protein n=1 Tax=Pararge aegeria aegeria TaxID=348720 RepID=A0A8S4QQI3_9NEOP|nr:uncharacterized protein LOC120635803 [Pararge aegeria]CAH2212199.1 jg2200 [Pararge aegeria aegeria]